MPGVTEGEGDWWRAQQVERQGTVTGDSGHDVV